MTTSKKQLKQITENLINLSDNLLNFLNSSTFQNQIAGQNIDGLDSPYKYGDDTLAEAIASIKTSLQDIKNNQDNINKIGYDGRNNIINVVTQINTWISSGSVLSYYQNIIQSSFQLTTILHQSGFNKEYGLNTNETRRLKKEIDEINKYITDKAEINDLVLDLKDIKTANQEMNKASEVLSFIQNTQGIEEVDEFVKNTTPKIEELLNKSENLLTSSSEAVLIRKFGDMADKYEKNSSGWRILVFLALVFWCSIS